MYIYIFVIHIFFKGRVKLLKIRGGIF